MLRTAVLALLILFSAQPAFADEPGVSSVAMEDAIAALPRWMQRHARLHDGQRVAARSLRDVVRAAPGFEKAFIRSVRIRKPASTPAGFLYEVTVRSLDREQAILLIDPSSMKVLKAPKGFGESDDTTDQPLTPEPPTSEEAQQPDRTKSLKKLPGWMRRHAEREDGTRVAARSLKAVIRSEPRFKKAFITSVFVRRPAPTSVGFMYEVWLRNLRGPEVIVYIDPVSRKILYEVPGG